MKNSEEEWLSFKNNQLLEVIQQDQAMTSILKLSYNHLPSNLKQCFAYSSLLLKDRLIKKDELIQQWLAQGFVQALNGSKSMEDIGNDYFMELCWRFFYENFSDEHNFKDDVYIHDLMHDLARMVAGNEYVGGNPNYNHVVCESTRHILFDHEIRWQAVLSNYNQVVCESTRHILFDHEIRSWQAVLSKLHKARGLRTFLLSNDILDRKNQMNEDVLDDLFYNFSRLRVLDLKYSHIERVKKSIKRLKHLRYLDLSGNYMKSLPNCVTKLIYLQTLNLKRCYALKKLPRGIRNLINLRHLNISDSTHLTHMPGGMGKLTCLQTLSLFMLDSHKHGGKLSELNGMNNLRGSLEIIGLENLKSTPSEASLANLKEKKGLQHLTLTWNLSRDVHISQDDEAVLGGLEPHPSIESLKISGYCGVKLPNWVSNPLVRLTRITIVNCETLQNLTPIHHLPALHSLYLAHLTSLRFIDNSDPYSSSLFFPSLESLCLMNMANLEGWWAREPMVEEVEKQGNFLPTFPRLTILSISNCPKLASMPGHPPLTEITLDGVGLQMMRTFRNNSDNTSPSSSNLKSLELKGIKDLKILPHKLQQNIDSLKYLYITECENLVNSLFDDMHSSTGLSSKHTELGDAMQWKFLPNLKLLHLENLPKLESLPIEVQHWSSLKSLFISKCPNFRMLPEWIGRLVALEELEIVECPKLKSLPEEIRELKALNHLRIAWCLELERRCYEGGEDRAKIAHVPHFWELKRHSYSRFEESKYFWVERRRSGGFMI